MKFVSTSTRVGRVLSALLLAGLALPAVAAGAGGGLPTPSLPGAAAAQVPVPTASASAAASTAPSATATVSAGSPTTSAPAGAVNGCARAKKISRACKATRRLAGVGFNESNLPIAFVAPNPCTAETVFVQGTFHVVLSTTVSGSGYRLYVAANIQRTSGVGEISGIKYQANETVQSEQRENTQSETFTERFGLQYELVSQGTVAPYDQNLLIRLQFKVTVTIGEPVPLAEDATLVCTGPGPPVTPTTI